MAVKMRMMKLLQELRGLAEVTHRRPPPRQPGLFLIQLRSHVQNRQLLNKKVIAVEMLGRLDVPHPVKIRHVQANVPAEAASQSDTSIWLEASQI